jgi:hypothetical protein
MYKSPSNAQMQQVKKNLIKHTYSSVDSAKIIHKHYGFQLLHVNSRKSVFLKSSPLPVCLNYLRCKINRKVNDHKSWWIKRCTIIYKFEFCSSFLLFYQIVLQQMKGTVVSFESAIKFWWKILNILYGMIELYYLSHYDTKLNF